MAVELDSTEEHAVVVGKLKTAKTVCAKGSRTTRPPDDHTHYETKTIKSEKNSPRRRKDQVGDVADGRDRRFLPRSSSPTRTAASKRTKTPGIRRRIGSGEDENPLQGESSIEEERGDRGRFIKYGGRKREGMALVKERGNRRFGRKEEQETPVAVTRNGKYDAEIRQRRLKNEHEVDVEERPKRRRRVIRIDPHDISNKRIVDSVNPGDIVVKKEAELSLNAQFRAIKPTPTILSFVEDNLLGRRRTHELKKAGFNIDLSAPLDNIPFSTRTDRERIEESVFRNSLEFFAAAKVSTSFPPPILPEIAFAGRSNVGKSSLLNALTRQWGVVRTSDKPGLTQTINFFRLASKLCLVDLPGYGFAYAKDEVKDAWEELVKEYVSTRESLQKVCVLIDTKWGMKPRDHELIELMERSKTPYQIVLTKTDLVFPMDVARRAMQIQEDLKTRKSIVEPVMMISSKSGAGIRSLRTVLAKFARFMKP